MGELVPPSVQSPEGDKNPFYLGKQCPYVGASAPQPAQARLCASRQLPHRALGPQPAAPSPGATLAGSQGGLGKGAKVCWPMVPGYTYIWPHGFWVLAACYGQRCGEAGSASLLCQLPGRGEKGASIIHTHQRRAGEEVGKQECWSQPGAEGAGAGSGRASPCPLTHVASGCSLGAPTLL